MGTVVVYSYDRKHGCNLLQVIPLLLEDVCMTGHFLGESIQQIEVLHYAVHSYGDVCTACV